jgi:sugar/nucleoside kinase (ribokinase family)
MMHKGRDDLPDYLMLGHVTKDKTPDGPILGGTSSYAAVTARKLGQKVAIVTSVGPDIPSMATLDGIIVRCLPDAESTTFENVYENGVRFQKWSAKGGDLTLNDIPVEWRQAAIVHFGPVAQEVAPSLIGAFPNSLICATVQGWLRGRDAESNVIYQPTAELEDWLPRIDVMVMSPADVEGQRERLVHLLSSVKLGVETLGPEGCRVYHQGETFHIPVRPMEEVDPTGAGDIFAAAFFIEYQRSRDFVKAARFANACGSLSVRRVGVEGAPNLDEVLAWVTELYG